MTCLVGSHPCIGKKKMTISAYFLLRPVASQFHTLTLGYTDTHTHTHTHTQAQTHTHTHTHEYIQTNRLVWNIYILYQVRHKEK